MARPAVDEAEADPTAAIHRIAVVVPAHNEDELIGACLRALAAAARAVRVPVHLVVVLDSCTDGTAAAVHANAGALASEDSSFADLGVVAIEDRSVGAARRAAARSLLAALPVPGTWLATTDADSRVPPNWFRAQLDHRAAGAEAVVGTVVVPDWSGRSASVTRAYLERYHSIDGHRHVHGANLSMTAEAYLRVGGFPARVNDEDVALVGAVVAAGYRVTWAADQPVATSARLTGRAPDGFAAFLNDLGANDLGAAATLGARRNRRRRGSVFEGPGTEAVPQ